MVMAVGLRDARAVAAGGAVVGAAAAVDWVLKDALGKVTRLKLRVCTRESLLVRARGSCN